MPRIYRPWKAFAREIRPDAHVSTHNENMKEGAAPNRLFFEVCA
jgi:hypothetical protein